VSRVGSVQRDLKIIKSNQIGARRAADEIEKTSTSADDVRYGDAASRTGRAALECVVCPHPSKHGFPYKAAFCG
jgi:hypothetical protein